MEQPSKKRATDNDDDEKRRLALLPPEIWAIIVRVNHSWSIKQIEKFCNIEGLKYLCEEGIVYIEVFKRQFGPNVRRKVRDLLEPYNISPKYQLLAARYVFKVPKDGEFEYETIVSQDVNSTLSFDHDNPDNTLKVTFSQEGRNRAFPFTEKEWLNKLKPLKPLRINSDHTGDRFFQFIFIDYNREIDETNYILIVAAIAFQDFNMSLDKQYDEYIYLGAPSFFSSSSWKSLSAARLRDNYQYFERTNEPLLRWFLALNFTGTKSSRQLAEESDRKVSQGEVKQIYEAFGYKKPTFKDAYVSVPQSLKEKLLGEQLTENTDKLNDVLTELQTKYSDSLKQNRELLEEVKLLKNKLKTCEEVKRDQTWQEILDRPPPPPPPSYEEERELQTKVEELKKENKEGVQDLLSQIRQGTTLKKPEKKKEERGFNESLLEITKRRQAIAPPEEDEWVDRECMTCGATENLKQCSACLAVQYCGRECQKEDFERHILGGECKEKSFYLG